MEGPDGSDNSYREFSPMFWGEALRLYMGQSPVLYLILLHPLVQKLNLDRLISSFICVLAFGFGLVYLFYSLTYMD